VEVVHHGPLDVENAIGKLIKHKSASTDQISAEMIQEHELHKLFGSIWNKEELPQQWKESIIVPIYKKGDKIDRSNYRGISLLQTIYKILYNILVSRLTHM
jgi:hypothetical protein